MESDKRYVMVKNGELFEKKSLIELKKGDAFRVFEGDTDLFEGQKDCVADSDAFLNENNVACVVIED